MVYRVLTYACFAFVIKYIAIILLTHIITYSIVLN